MKFASRVLTTKGGCENRKLASNIKALRALRCHCYKCSTLMKMLRLLTIAAVLRLVSFAVGKNTEKTGDLSDSDLHGTQDRVRMLAKVLRSSNDEVELPTRQRRFISQTSVRNPYPRTGPFRSFPQGNCQNRPQETDDFLVRLFLTLTCLF